MLYKIMLSVGILFSVVTTGRLRAQPIRTIVVDTTSNDGRVVLVQWDDKEIRTKTLCERATSFNGNARGPYVYRSVDGDWRVGDFSVRRAETHLPAASVPINARECAIAPDGSLLAWVCGTDAMQTLRFTTASVAAASAPAQPLTTTAPDGTMRCPAWSPDATRCAYYWQGKEGGFALRCATVLRSRTAVPTTSVDQEVAPVSLWTRLSETRDQAPRWSPDGRYILFEGRYSTKQPPTMRYSLVRSDGRGLIPAVWGNWTEDSTHLLTINSTGDVRTGITNSVGRMRLDGDGVVPVIPEPSKCAMPASVIAWEWDISGSHIAYVHSIEGKPGVLLDACDVGSGKVTSLLRAGNVGAIIWAAKALGWVENSVPATPGRVK